MAVIQALLLVILLEPSVACVGQCPEQVNVSASLLQKVSQEVPAGRVSKPWATWGTFGIFADCSVDVVLIIDRSGSVADHWADMKKAASNFASALFAVSKAGSRVGVVSFSKSARSHLGLSGHLQTVLDAINKGIEDPSGGTNVMAGLDTGASQLRGSTFQKDQRVALLITDGEPTVPGSNANGYAEAKDKATKAANTLKTGARLTVVGVSGGDTHYMQSLATAPSSENYHGISGFDQLASEQYIKQILEDVCRTANPTSQPTIQPTAGPTPTCYKDTTAPCAFGKDEGGLCFQKTRGDTYCNKDTGTCWCKNDDECVYNRSFLTTVGGEWSVCRKNDEDVRGEDSTITWLAYLVSDIVDSYMKASSR